MKNTRLIIAGGRDFNDMPFMLHHLNAWRTEYQIDMDDLELVCGMAEGADKLGYEIFQLHQLPIRPFPAQWHTHGKRAGFLRNEKMAQYATHLLAFWDKTSRGTAHMIRTAQTQQLPTTIVYY